MKKQPISEKLNQIIISSILGDGHIRYVGKNARLEFSHAEKQKEYLFWKYEMLKEFNLTTSEPKFLIIGKDKKYYQYRFYTKTDILFNDYHYMFHKDKRKKITRKILNMLNPLGLAIWYMDDGNLAIHYYKKKNGEKAVKSRQLMLNTQQFTYEEQLIIKRYFKVVWDIDVNINKNKNSYRIVMGANSAKKFIDIIKHHIHPSMEQKIDLKYIEK